MFCRATWGAPSLPTQLDVVAKFENDLRREEKIAFGEREKQIVHAMGGRRASKADPNKGILGSCVRFRRNT